ncbi:SdpI family protein [Gorillibacterium timonense]|uniref:SdpI family protein n=1 Tax=Gorillibacterium timonense TaxID=1689269 RepID=UPI00071D3346|nr:SdpI family protein [Gorillibacterium timonense]
MNGAGSKNKLVTGQMLKGTSSEQTKNKKFRLSSWVAWGIALVPVMALMVLYPHMSDRVPVHYNAAGAADRYADKFSFDMLLFALLGFIGPLLMKPIGYFVIRAQEAEGNGSASLRFYMNTVAALVALLFTAMSIHSMLRMTDLDVLRSISLERIVAFFLGLLLLGLGNFMPKLKRNRLSGFRTRRNLEDADVWFKTQRFAGKVWMAGGASVALSAFLPGSLFLPAAISLLVLLVLIPLVYGRRLAR